MLSLEAPEQLEKKFTGVASKVPHLYQFRGYGKNVLAKLCFNAVWVLSMRSDPKPFDS